MRDLCRIARENNNRLVLTGDIGQHNSVQAGDALRALQTYGNVVTARLTKIRRQRDPAFRAAVSLLADKKAYRAFEEFYRMGAVKEVADPKMLMQMAVDDYLKTIGQKKSCLVISPVCRTSIGSLAKSGPGSRRRVSWLKRTRLSRHTIPTSGPTRPGRMPANTRWVMSWLSIRTAPGSPKGNMSPLRNSVGKRSWCGMKPGGGSPSPPSEVEGFDVGLSRSLPVSVGERLLIRAN